jgi:hypothetical protein
MNKEPAANTTLSHYRIVSKIGAGGMGEVYRSHRGLELIQSPIDNDHSLPTKA